MRKRRKSEQFESQKDEVRKLKKTNRLAVFSFCKACPRRQAVSQMNDLVFLLLRKQKRIKF
jgi:hypothetical protein